jgi:propane monooxygenase reductase component
VSPRVLLEPIGEEIGCGAEESILDAAFRQGFSLVHGCREGQCSACKAYVLEGQVALRPYSTFALSDHEESTGYTLLCRAMPEEDLVVELLHFDAENYRLEHELVEAEATVVGLEPLTHDLVRLVLRPGDAGSFSFTPGQYVDLWVPGAPARRSFSMANLPGEGVLELIVRRYPQGRFSGQLGKAIRPGSAVCLSGPYGALRLRPGDCPVLLIAGGSGMAPVLSLLRQLAADRAARPVRFFYGARARRDLFWLDVVAALGDRLADFGFVPVLSEPLEGDGWDGAVGLVHEVVAHEIAGGRLPRGDAYLCGPPPMIESATELLTVRAGFEEERIFHDKFTMSADAEGGR